MKRSPLCSIVHGLAVAALLATAPLAGAQTVRFQTSVGAFDMLLNPTGNANLRQHVDNMLANVAAGVYHFNVVNRAAEGFVLQIGSFQADSNDVSEVPLRGWGATDAFSPLVVDANNDGRVDFSTTGLTNTRGTVSLALSSGNANSGSASFFVNLGDNSGSDSLRPNLDGQNFIPFATIADMATVDRIMALQQTDLSQEVGQNGSLAFIDVPLTSDGELVIVETASVISPSSVRFDGPILSALGQAPRAPITPAGASPATPSSLTSSAPASLPVSAPPSTGPLAIPEPSALCLVAVGGGLSLVRPSRRR
ncbi:MAG: peptidylprolyl isomerase [Lacipirellulaceae bacterium]